MSNQGYVDLTIDSPEVAVRKHFSPPPANNALNHNNRVSPNFIGNVPAQNGVLEPKMNAQYMNAPLQQPQLAHNQFKLPHQQPQPPQPPILESLLEGNFQNVYERVMGGNVVQEGIDALQAHINKTKVFQAMHQRAPVEEKYIPRGVAAPGVPNVVDNRINMYNNQYSPTAVISFSLVNTTEFSAKAEVGLLPVETLPTLMRVHGVRFDTEQKRFLFPLSEHDNLQVAMAAIRVIVEPLPRTVIAAAQLSHRRDNPSRVVDIDCNDDEIDIQKAIEEKAAATTKILQGKIKERLLGNLAPFQREGVLFVMNNNGRSLIADEMGLGKTRSAIGAAVAYQDEWPVLVVCPSSARHHWQAEILQLLAPEYLSSDDVCVVESSTFRLTRRFPKPKKHRDSNDSTDKNNSSNSSNSNGSGSNGSSSCSSNGTTTTNSSSSSSSSSSASKCLFKFVIISYTLIPLMIESLEELNFKIVIADECHYLKNAKAARTKGLVILLRKSLRAILLSGTPALSRPMELFTQLNALDPVSWPCIKAFGRRYCRTKRKKKGGFGAEFNGASNTQELHILLAGSLMIRRLKIDILSELPKKIRTIVRVEIQDPEQKEDLAYLLSVVKVMEEKKKLKRQRVRAENRVVGLDNDDNSDEEAKRRAKLPSEVFTKQDEKQNEKRVFPDKKTVLLELFTKSGVAKVEGIIPHIGMFLDDIMSGKLLVFAHHRNVLDKIEKYLKERGTGHIRIDGSVLGKSRHGLVTHFQESSKCRVALLSITAAGVAITLTAASTVYFAEMYWTPGSLMQAEDRAHRIGQVNTVKVKYFLTEGSVDDILWPMVRAKIKVLGEVVEGNGSMDMSLNKGDPFEFHQTTKDGHRNSFANNEISGALKEIIADERAEVRKVKMEKKGHKGGYQENANGVINLDDDDDEDEGDGDTDDGDFSNIFKEDNEDCFSGGTSVKSENGGFGEERTKRILPGSLGGKESADKGNGEEPEGPDLLAQLYMAYQSRSLKGSSSSSSSSSSSNSTYYCSHNGTTNPNRMPSINNMTGNYPGSSGYIHPAKNGITSNGSSSSSSSSNVTAYRRSIEVITLDDCDSDDDNGSGSQAHDYQKQHEVQEENAKHVMNGSQSSHSSAVLSALRGLSSSTEKSAIKSEVMAFSSSYAGNVSRSGPQDVIDLIGDDDSDNDFLYSKPSFNSVRKAPSPSASSSSLPSSSEANLTASTSLKHKEFYDGCDMSAVPRLPSPIPSQLMLPVDPQLDSEDLVEVNEVQQETGEIDLSDEDIPGSNNSDTATSAVTAAAASPERTPSKSSSQLHDSGFDNTSGRRRSNGEVLDISSPPKQSNGSSNYTFPSEHIAKLLDASHDKMEPPAGGHGNLARLSEFLLYEEMSHPCVVDQDRTQTGLSSPPSHFPSGLSSSSSVSAAKSPESSLNHVIIPSFSSHNQAIKGQLNHSVEMDNREDTYFGSIKRDGSNSLADCDDDLIILCPKVDIDKKVLHTLARSSMFASINGAEHSH